MIHQLADCQTDQVGSGSNIWQFTVVLEGAHIGKDCNICSHVFIESDVIIGDRVTIKSGVQLWDGTRIGHDVFVGPNVSFSNDKFPRSKQYPTKFLKTIIGDGASIGAGAVILPGIIIGKKAMIGAGAVVTRNVLDGSTVVGNPASVIGHSSQSPRDKQGRPD